MQTELNEPIDCNEAVDAKSPSGDEATAKIGVMKAIMRHFPMAEEMKRNAPEMRINSARFLRSLDWVSPMFNATSLNAFISI